MTKLTRALQRLEEVASIVLLAMLTLVIGAQIFFRYALNSPLAWSEELAQFLMVCLTFVAATAVLKRGEHYSIDAFVNLLPSIGRRWAGIMVDGAQVLLLVSLAYYSLSLASVYTGTASVLLKIPEEAKAYLMAYCFLSMALHLVWRMVQAFSEH